MDRYTKKHVSNRSSLRKAYLTNEPYTDFMRRVPNRAIVNQYKAAGMKYPESIFQKPYDDPFVDYQTLEQTWYPYESSPLHPSGNKIPDLNKSCLRLWKSLFGDWGGGIAGAKEMKHFQEYAKKCPTKFIDSMCCEKIDIQGPSSLIVNRSAHFSMPIIQGKCAYTWKAEKGIMVSGYYTAPETPCTDRISVCNYFGNTECAFKFIQIKSADCGGAAIAAPTNQMSVGQSMTLSVLNPEPGVVYTWAISSGGGTINASTGLYTAPATNENCANNPTIQLKAGSNVCASVKIAINGYSVAEAGLVKCYSYGKAYPIDGCPGKCGAGVIDKKVYCNGTLGPNQSDCFGGSNCEYGCGDEALDRILAFCGGACSPRVIDNRTPAMKAAGCCPSQLL